MIYIEEFYSDKIPGVSSLKIKFDYKAEIVQTLKQIHPALYDKKTRTWEVSSTELKHLVDELTEYDDIDIVLAKDKSAKRKTEQDIKLSKYKVKPFEHQEEAIRYGLTHDKWLLLDAPGLGKTMSMIYLAQEIKKRDDIEHCLIVCGVNTLKSNWKSEIEKFSNLSCCILGARVNTKGVTVFDGIPKRIEQLNKKIKEFFVITNIESFADKNFVNALKKSKNKFEMIVLDECHKMKDPNALRTKGLFKCTNAKYKIALTGTLVMNDPIDTYCALKWIDAEKSNYTNFKSFYCTYGGFMNRDIVGYRNLNYLKDTLSNCSLRRTKDILNLPEKIIINEQIDMNDVQRTFYDNITNGILSEVDKVKMTTANLLSMIARLRQATACPSILTTEKIKSSKIERACELVDEITSNGNKVVIFSTFKDTLNELKDSLKRYNPLLCSGDVKDSTIKDNIDKFQSDDKYKVFLCTWQKCGTGITLTAANYEIFIDTPYTEADYEQAQDRCHRIGQKNALTIYNLICKDTVDERVKQIVDNKSALGDYIVDDTITKSGLELLKQFIEELR